MKTVYNWSVKELSKKQVGDLGEELASRFLSKKGYRMVGKNYLKKWGEIDLIAKYQRYTSPEWAKLSGGYSSRLTTAVVTMPYGCTT